MSDLVVGKNRRRTSYRVEFPTIPSLSSQPSRVDLVQKQGHHDVLILEFPIEMTLWESLLNTGVPLKFTWKQDHLVGTWLGYVSFVSTEVAAQRKKITQVHCIGAGFPLKDRTTRTFTNKTIPEAVEIIAKEYGLKYIGENHPHRFEQLNISGDSYWGWIQEQAKRIGYAAFIDGPSLVFRPFDKLIDHDSHDTPILAMFNRDTPGDIMELDRTLDYFRATKGDYIESDQEVRSTKTTAGIDPVTKTLIFSTKNPSNVGVNLRSNPSEVLFTEHRADKVVHSQFYGDYAAEGSAHIARFNMPAKVKCQGDIRIRPYMPVYISGTSETTDGYWIVKEVSHTFLNAGNYGIEMTVLTDGTKKNASNTSRVDPRSMVGIIDVESRINSKQNLSNRFDSNQIALNNSDRIVFENNQGFNKTQARWQYRKGSK